MEVGCDAKTRGMRTKNKVYCGNAGKHKIKNLQLTFDRIKVLRIFLLQLETSCDAKKRMKNKVYCGIGGNPNITNL